MPGIPQIYPQNINIIKIVITFIENDLPIKTGSKIPPIITWTRVIVSIKNNKAPVASSSTKANNDNNTTEITEPIICTKLIAKANRPQKIGKLTSKK